MAELVIRAATRPELIAQCAQEILATGEFVILPLHELETQTEFCERVNVSARTLYRRLRSRFAKGTGVLSESGPSGKLIWIRSTPKFDLFARRRRTSGQQSAFQTGVSATI